MTVCVAAIGDNGQMLILAADRMLTGLAQYESPNPKVFELTRSIAVMWSGSDVSFQSLIHNRLRADVNARVKANPDKWLGVEEVANLYLAHYNDVTRGMMEQSVLEPFGFDRSSFLKEEPTMGRRLAERLSQRIASFAPPEISALIVGMDTMGSTPETVSEAHIYKFENYGRTGRLSCEDAIGFAAIGSGAVHAESELMKSGHGPSRSGDKTLLVTYLAKKRGQAGPGVGEETDFYYFHQRPPYPSYLARVGDDISETLKKEYQRLKETESKAARRIERELAELLANRAPRPQPIGQASAEDAAIVSEAPTGAAKAIDSPLKKNPRSPPRIIRILTSTPSGSNARAVTFVSSGGYRGQAISNLRRARSTASLNSCAQSGFHASTFSTLSTSQLALG